MKEPLGFEVQVPLGFDAAIAATREALKAQGFGILTEIDVRNTFQEKLRKDFRPYTILGACNPPLAYSAVTADPTVGLLLPCNVTVEAHEGNESIVRLTNPRALLGAAAIAESPVLADVAEDARERMERVRDTLTNIAAPVT